MKTIAFTAVILLSQTLFAFDPSLSEKKASMEPCASWRYDFDARGYVCGYLSPRLSVYSAAEIDSLITKLENKIAALEARVKTLEEKP